MMPTKSSWAAGDAFPSMDAMVSFTRTPPFAAAPPLVTGVGYEADIGGGGNGERTTMGWGRGGVLPSSLSQRDGLKNWNISSVFATTAAVVPPNRTGI